MCEERLLRGADSEQEDVPGLAAAGAAGGAGLHLPDDARGGTGGNDMVAGVGGDSS